jgi:nitrilase
LASGGSCIAAPNGDWLIEPQIGEEGGDVATIGHNKVLQERQNSDPVGHYSRPDDTQLQLNRQRQSILKVTD